jgi:hypothetical protein
MPCGLGQVQGDLAVEVETFNPSRGNRRHHVLSRKASVCESVNGEYDAWTVYGWCGRHGGLRVGRVVKNDELARIQFMPFIAMGLPCPPSSGECI